MVRLSDLHPSEAEQMRARAAAMEEIEAGPWLTPPPAPSSRIPTSGSPWTVYVRWPTTGSTWPCSFPSDRYVRARSAPLLTSSNGPVWPPPRSASSASRARRSGRPGLCGCPTPWAAHRGRPTIPSSRRTSSAPRSPCSRRPVAGCRKYPIVVVDFGHASWQSVPETRHHRGP